MKTSNPVEILAVPGIPLVRKDDDLVALIGEGLARGGIVPRGGDVFVLTQKIVSKAEGRKVDLATVEPSAKAIELARSPSQKPATNYLRPVSHFTKPAASVRPAQTHSLSIFQNTNKCARSTPVMLERQAQG